MSFFWCTPQGGAEGMNERAQALQQSLPLWITERRLAIMPELSGFRPVAYHIFKGSHEYFRSIS